MSINTDGRTVTPVTLSGEYELMEKVFNWNKEHFLKCNLEAIEHSFTTPALKGRLSKQIEAAYFYL